MSTKYHTLAVRLSLLPQSGSRCVYLNTCSSEQYCTLIPSVAHRFKHFILSPFLSLCSLGVKRNVDKRPFYFLRDSVHTAVLSDCYVEGAYHLAEPLVLEKRTENSRKFLTYV